MNQFQIERMVKEIRFRRGGPAIEQKPEEPVGADLEQIQKALHPWLEGFRGEMLERFRASIDVTLRQNYDFKKINESIGCLERAVFELSKWRAEMEKIISAFHPKGSIIPFIRPSATPIKHKQIEQKPKERRRWDRGGKILNLQEAARHLSIAPRTLYNLVHTREIPFFKGRKNLRFDSASIDDWWKTRYDLLPRGVYSHLKREEEKRRQKNMLS